MLPCRRDNGEQRNDQNAKCSVQFHQLFSSLVGRSGSQKFQNVALVLRAQYGSYPHVTKHRSRDPGGKLFGGIVAGAPVLLKRTLSPIAWGVCWRIGCRRLRRLSRW